MPWSTACDERSEQQTFNVTTNEGRRTTSGLASASARCELQREPKAAKAAQISKTGKHLRRCKQVHHLQRRAVQSLGSQKWLSVLSPVRERDEWIEFVEMKPYNLDLAMSWHSPNSLRIAERGWDERWLQMKLLSYFVELDRHVFGAASCRRHTDRLVVLQHADGVGWHAHGQIRTPKRFSQVEFAELAKSVWLGSLKGHTLGPFGRQLFWSEPAIAGHLPYILKELNRNKVDEENTRLT